MSSRFERIDVGDDRTRAASSASRKDTLPPRGRRGRRRARSSPTPARSASSRSTTRRCGSCASRARRSASRTCWRSRPASSTSRASRRWRPPSASWPRRSASRPSTGSRSAPSITSPGFTDEEVHLFLATGLSDVDERPEVRRERAHRRRGPPAVRARRHARRDEGLQDADRAAAALRDKLAALNAALAPRQAPAPPRRSRCRGRRRPHPAVRAPRARLPRLPRVRARAVAQHARGLPLRPAAVRRAPRAHRARRARARPRRARRLRRRRWRPAPRTARAVKPATLQRKVACLRSFYRHLRRQELLADDPTVQLRAPRQSRKLPQVLTRDEVARLLEQPRGTEPAALRDRALLEIMYACGLRASEATGLELSDLDLESGILRARGKGNKERLVPVGSTAAARAHRLPQARPPAARRRPAASRGCSSTTAAAASPARGSTRSSSATPATPAWPPG